MKLHVLAPSPNARKVRLLIEYLSLPVEVLFHQVPEIKVDEYLGLNPMGLVPLLEDGDFSMWESNAILLYLVKKAGNKELFPDDPHIQGKILQWMFWEQAHFVKGVGGLLYFSYIVPTYLAGEVNQPRVDEAITNFHKFMPILEKQLSENSYIIGDSVTVADFCLNGFFMRMEETKMPINDYPAIQAWIKRLENIPAWQAVQC